MAALRVHLLPALREEVPFQAYGALVFVAVAALLHANFISYA